ncbi:MAG: flagellar hook-associated protein 2 [Candidimonas sp.]|nr:MAG: flagellar hook-associated protein 2 [Candidimonas sp.]
MASLDSLTTPTANQAGAISFLGSGSGLPLATLLSQLQTNASQGLTLLQNRETGVQAKISAYGQLQSAVAALATAAQALTQTGALGQLAANVSGNDITAAVQSQSAPGTAPAVPGTYTIDVTQLARQQTLVAAGQADATTAIGSGGIVTFTYGNGSTQTLDLSGQDTSVQGLMQAINGDAALGLQATVLNDGSATPWRLMISPDQSGTAAAITNISVSGNSALSSLLSMPSMTQQTAADAQFSVNGVAITSSSNNVTSAIPGVTLGLNAASGQPQTLTISQDTTAASQAITAYVNAYNSLQSTIASLTAFNTSTNTGSVLTGDSVARQLQSSLSTVMNFSSPDETAFQTLGSLGIMTQDGGTVSIDQSALAAALAQNPSAVSTLFDGPNGLSNFTGNLLNTFTDTNGSLALATSGQNTQLTALQDQYQQQSQLIAAQVQTWQTQFASLDASVAVMNNTSSYLTQQFAAMSGSTK